MNNADKPAMPLRGVDGGIFSCRDGYLEQADIASGLTKREHFAAMAMQGILAKYGPDEQRHETTATDAIDLADALLAELEKAQ